MDKKNAACLREETLNEINQQHKGNDATTQEDRALLGLQTFGSLTTQDLRQELDIMHPAGRILSLRVIGYDIKTIWENYPTSCGKIHRMARYVYFGKMAVAA
jgi:hypothetical protein